MPLLQFIVGELDRELVRLHALRELVADLGQAPPVAFRIDSSPVVASKPKESVLAAILPLIEPTKPERKVRALAGQPRERRTPKPALSPEPRALAKPMASGPVVFNPTRLAEEKAKRQQSREAQQAAEPVRDAEDLDALSRSLAARWSTGLVQ